MRFTIFFILISLAAKAQDCSVITKKVDKFDSTVTLTSPFTNPCYFLKIEKSNDTVVILHLTSYGSTLNSGVKGVVILLADGTKISRPGTKVKTDVHNSDSDWKYSAYLVLSSEEIEQLLKSSITDYKLYIYEASVNANTAENYKQYLRCIKDMK